MWVQGFKSFSPQSADSFTSSRISRECVEKMFREQKEYVHQQAVSSFPSSFRSPDYGMVLPTYRAHPDLVISGNTLRHTQRCALSYPRHFSVELLLLEPHVAKPA